jgi:uncharacterized protein (UPF0276 family)
MDAVGVGVNSSPSFHLEVMRHARGAFDFVELDPEHYLLERPGVAELLGEFRGAYPVVLHSTTLSIAGDNALDLELLAQSQRVAGLTGACLYSDHLSFSHAGPDRLDLYMPPIYSAEMVGWVKRRARAVRSHVAVPFAVENVGQLLDAPFADFSEHEFFAAIWRDAGVALQLNLDSTAISAATLGVDPLEYLATFPFEAVVTIAVVPEQSMNPILRQRFGANLDTLALRMLDLALSRSDARRVMVQRRYAEDSLDALAPFLGATREIWRRRRGAAS